MNKFKLKSLLFWFIILISVFSVVIFFSNLHIIPVTPDWGGSDLFQLNYPLKHYLATSLKKFSIPLWNPYVGAGFPQLAESQIGFYFIPNIILFGMFPFTSALQLSYLVIFIWSFIGMYLFLRSLSLTKISCFYGAVLFSFSGFFITHMTHINLIQAASFMPWIFFTTNKYLHNNNFKYLLATSLLLSQQLFAGFVQMYFITLVGICMYYVIVLWQRKKKLIIHLTFIVVAVALSIILSLAQIIPSLELMSLSSRAKGFDYSYTTQYSYPLKHLITFFSPYFLGDQRTGAYPIFTKNSGSIFWENTAYIGVLPFFLLLFSFFTRTLRRTILPVLFCGALSLLLMLGKYSPLYFIYTFYPFNLFRVPSRFIIIFIFFIIILTAYGLNFILIKTSLYKKIYSYIIYCIVCLSIVQLLIFGAGYNKFDLSTKYFKNPATADYLQNQSDFTRYYSTHPGDDWNKYMTSNGWKDMKPYYYLHNSLMSNSNLLYNLPSLNVYPILLTNRYATYLSLLNMTTLNDFDIKLLRMANVNYIITQNKVPKLKEQYNIKPYKDNLSLFYIYKIDGNKRAWFIDTVKIANTFYEFVNIVYSKNFNPATFGIFEKKYKNFPGEGVASKNNKLKVLTYSSNYIKLESSTISKKTLILSDLYYPGWKVYINGRESQIAPANIFMRAVNVPKGKSIVEFYYDPENVKMGIYISIISYALVIAFFFKYLIKDKYF